jgi:hypothetical protein
MLTLLLWALANRGRCEFGGGVFLPLPFGPDNVVVDCPLVGEVDEGGEGLRRCSKYELKVEDDLFRCRWSSGLLIVEEFSEAVLLVSTLLLLRRDMRDARRKLRKFGMMTKLWPSQLVGWRFDDWAVGRSDNLCGWVMTRLRPAEVAQ